MYEKEKLDEAAYFLEKMCELQDSPREFRYHLSAFLSAARSVLQYAREEVQGKAGGLPWYEGFVASHPVCKFFKDKRDINIHEKPVSYNQTVNVGSGEICVTGHPCTMRISDAAGNVISENKAEESTLHPSPSRPPAGRTFSYEFADWAGPDKDVLSLSATYLQDLQQFVKDGRTAGFLN